MNTPNWTIHYSVYIMKINKLLGERFKNAPSDCTIASHSLMVRGGYIKQVSSGIYSNFMPMQRIIKKIEQIIREEMDKIDGQEVLFPVVLPAQLWEESKRFETVGNELVRLKDRLGNNMVLGMTHEEAAVQLARETAISYTQYPFMIYQFQTKFRDEPRSRGGLIRVREFTMKDAYSFHTSQESLDEYYNQCLESYNTIFRRTGLPQVISVQSDSGMMGGNISHEFMLLTDIGEDSIVTCNDCAYRSNMEVADALYEAPANEDEEAVTLVETPNQKTIDDVHKFFNAPITKMIKAVVYKTISTDRYFVVFIRGDLEVNETKLRNYVGEDIYIANIEPDCKLTSGFIGVLDFPDEYHMILDSSLKNTVNMICGANKMNYHYTGVNIQRDCNMNKFVDVAKVIEKGICPVCGKHSLSLRRGIEVGNIFQLGTKYTKSMSMTYIDSNGQKKTPIMGCYGIGLGRLAASICEVSHDDYGPIWPISIAPWQVHICALRSDDQNVRSVSDTLYDNLLAHNVDTIYDDRNIRPGFMFSDADLLGVPIRVIVSPRSLETGVVEIVSRNKEINQKTPVENAVQAIISLRDDMLKKLQ